MSSIRLIVFSLALAIGGTLLPNEGHAALVVHDLRCEGRAEPLGIGTARPHLGWVLRSNRRGEAQSAYQVIVASSPEKLARGEADLWDSGKVTSANSVQVPYGGKPLRSGQRAWWKVQVWDKNGEASGFSAAAWFEAALLRADDWSAQWIQRRSAGPLSEAQMFEDQPAPIFRKEFTLDKAVARARAYVSGLGYYELRLNGGRVGDHVLEPGWTSYDKRVLYSVYDVTDQLQAGHNALGMMLGNGWFNPLPLRMWGHVNPRDALTIGEPRAIAQLVIEFEDGTSQTFGTDETWRVTGGPILRNSVYLGEWYDARNEQEGWDTPGFDDSAWERAALAIEPKVGPLEPQEAPPIRVTKVLPARRVTEPKPGVFIFDFGQNFAGWARLRVTGPEGTRVRMRFGELLYPDGTLNGMTAVCGQIKGGGTDYRYDGKGQPKTAFQLNEYVLKGRGMETFTPRFTFHGFRYAEVTGYPGRPPLDALEGLRLNSDVARAGHFSCSNDLFNRIQEMVLWTELSNIFSVQSDCPHREKFGYGGDIVASSEMAMLNFDMHGFYTKAAWDFVDAVRPNGGFTETAPFVGISDEGLGEKSGPVGWGTAQPLLLAQLREYYGERQLLEAQYAASKRWLGLLQSCAKEGILDNGISDHESLAPKPRALTGTAFYYANARLLEQIARTLGKEADAREAAALSESIKKAFNDRFLKRGTGQYDIGSQACQAFALFYNLVPEDERQRALDVLIADLAKHEHHLTTGIFGTKYLLAALTDAGRADLAFRIVNQRTFPGWGHMLEQGATTLWEHWEFSDNTFSHNHPMFGSVSEWFFKALAGIQPAPDAVGFDTIVIKPQPVGDLRSVQAYHDTVRGRIASEWQRADGKLTLRVAIPVGAEAIVHVPVTDPNRVKEGGRPAGSVPGVRYLRVEEGAAVFAIGSGEYEFTAE